MKLYITLIFTNNIARLVISILYAIILNIIFLQLNIVNLEEFPVVKEPYWHPIQGTAHVLSVDVMSKSGQVYVQNTVHVNTIDVSYSVFKACSPALGAEAAIPPALEPYAVATLPLKPFTPIQPQLNNVGACTPLMLSTIREELPLTKIVTPNIINKDLPFETPVVIKVNPPLMEIKPIILAPSVNIQKIINEYNYELMFAVFKKKLHLNQDPLVNTKNVMSYLKTAIPESLHAKRVEDLQNTNSGLVRFMDRLAQKVTLNDEMDVLTLAACQAAISTFNVFNVLNQLDDILKLHQHFCMVSEETLQRMIDKVSQTNK